MNIDPRYSVMRDRAALGRLAFGAPLLAMLVLYLWYFTGVRGLMEGHALLTWVLIPLSWFLLIVSPLLLLSWWKNDAPALMLTDTAMYFRPMLWSFEYQAVRREAVRRVLITSMNVHGRQTGHTLLIEVDPTIPALGPPGMKARINTFFGRRLLKSDVAIACGGWTVAPEDVKARIETWAAQRN